MASDPLIDIADAVVALLNSDAAQAGFQFQFTAKRAYRPLYPLKKKNAGLHVTVMPSALEETPFSRSVMDCRVSVDVGVQNYVKPDNEVEECDELMLLVKQIKDLLEHPLSTYANPNDWLDTAHDPIYDPDHLTEDSVLTSVPTFKYFTRRPR